LQHEQYLVSTIHVIVICLLIPALSWMSGNAYYANNYGLIPNQSTVYSM